MKEEEGVSHCKKVLSLVFFFYFTAEYKPMPAFGKGLLDPMQEDDTARHNDQNLSACFLFLLFLSS